MTLGDRTVRKSSAKFVQSRHTRLTWIKNDIWLSDEILNYLSNTWYWNVAFVRTTIPSENQSCVDGHND